MTKTKLTLALLALGAFVFTGCMTQHQTITEWPDGTYTTNVVSQIDPVRTSAAVKAIIPPVVRLSISKDPNTRDYFVKAQIAAKLVASSDKLSPDDLKAALLATGIREIQTPEVQVAIESIYAVYQVYYSDVVAAKLNENEWLVPVLSAISDGLAEGLQ